MVEVTNSRQRKTLQKIFRHPTPNDVPWSDVESLFEHLGFTIEFGSGSRTKFSKGHKIFCCHRPHPGNQTHEDTVRGIKKYLARNGVEP
jgi:predicted RNA binding protein YcfA (HicA-like mRNA interferase family)